MVYTLSPVTCHLTLGDRYEVTGESLESKASGAERSLARFVIRSLPHTGNGLYPVTCNLSPNMLKDFLESRLEKWKRLENLAARASRFRLSNLSGKEVREFGQLYRRAAADLAIAREEVRDQRLINYLNHLVGRAHGAIYRSESSGFGVFITFLRYEFPAVFRKTFLYTFTAFLVFAASAIFASSVSLLDEGFAERIAPQLKQDIIAHNNSTDRINSANPLALTSIQRNNITVTFYAFGGGVSGGIFTLFVLIQNGLQLGMVLSLCFRYRFWDIPKSIAETEAQYHAELQPVLNKNKQSKDSAAHSSAKSIKRHSDVIPLNRGRSKRVSGVNPVGPVVVRDYVLLQLRSDAFGKTLVKKTNRRGEYGGRCKD